MFSACLDAPYMLITSLRIEFHESPLVVNNDTNLMRPLIGCFRWQDSPVIVYYSKASATTWESPLVAKIDIFGVPDNVLYASNTHYRRFEWTFLENSWQMFATQKQIDMKKHKSVWKQIQGQGLLYFKPSSFILSNSEIYLS